VRHRAVHPDPEVLTPKTSDAGPARAAVGADKPAFDAVYRAQRQPLVRVAYLIVRSEAVAEELVHDAFLRLHDNFAEVESPPAFLRTALVRLCLSWLRRATTERDRLDRVAATAVLSDPPADTDLEGDRLWAAVGRLRPERRAAVILRFHADVGYAAIAEYLGCPEPTARSHVHRGLRDLRKEIR
jgi:RNA polymerase sigma factor (sigma-70 family)